MECKELTDADKHRIAAAVAKRVRKAEKMMGWTHALHTTGREHARVRAYSMQILRSYFDLMIPNVPPCASPMVEAAPETIERFSSLLNKWGEIIEHEYSGSHYNVSFAGQVFVSATGFPNQLRGKIALYDLVPEDQRKIEKQIRQLDAMLPATTIKSHSHGTNKGLTIEFITATHTALTNLELILEKMAQGPFPAEVQQALIDNEAARSYRERGGR